MGTIMIQIAALVAIIFAVPVKSKTRGLSYEQPLSKKKKPLVETMVMQIAPYAAQLQYYPESYYPPEDPYEEAAEHIDGEYYPPEDPYEVAAEHTDGEYYPEEDHYPETEHITFTVTNVAFHQPFGSFFVMVHNDEIEPLFKFGRAASDELASLAETGDPEELIVLYKNRPGVFSVEEFDEGAPYSAGDPAPEITVEVSQYYPKVTVASKILNTNDGFIAINGKKIENGQRYALPGLDAGTKTNDELCESGIPGPACEDARRMNSYANPDAASEEEDGEGAVHVHRGIHGYGDLPADEYDWRNPIAV